MNHFSTWIKMPFTRRRFFGVIGLGLYYLAFKTVSAANVTYFQVKKFLIRSVEGTQHVDLTLEILFKPTYTELDGPLAMRRIGQTVVCATDHMKLFGDAQIVKDA
jgi:hypothetical protein